MGASGACGVSLGIVPCFEIAPGVADPSCTEALRAAFNSGSIEGCCRPEGRCGTLLRNELGCVPAAESIATIPCGRASEIDAGGS